MLSDLHKKLYFHIGSWLSFFLIIIFSADELDKSFILKSLATFIPAFLLFYVLILWVFPVYHKGPLRLSPILLTLAFTICAIFLKPVLLYTFNQDRNIPFDRIAFWVQFRYNILFAGVAFAYHYASQLIKTQLKSKELEKENADARLALLKNQLNPHFLYNSLSLLYAKALPYSEDLAALVGEISDILRYSLDEPLDEAGMVDIAKETAHIENYINIHSQRFDDKINVDFEIKGDMQGRKIIPMLLITFVENAFKHGDMKSAIRFSLHLENGIEFISENSIGKISKKHVGGIGIENIRKRLELIYPQKHSLTVRQSENTYLVHLKIWD